MLVRYDMLGLVQSFPSLRNADYWKRVTRKLPGPQVKRPMKESGPLTPWADAKHAAAGGRYSDEETRYEFDARRLDRWVRTWPGVTAGSLMAGRFVLQVWNPSTKWTAGRFNVVEAMQRWDYAHRDAFLAWARDPWWP